MPTTHNTLEPPFAFRTLNPRHFQFLFPLLSPFSPPSLPYPRANTRTQAFPGGFPGAQNGGFPGAQNGGGFPGGQNGGNPFGQGQFPGFGNPGAATSQTQSGQNAQNSADANTSAQDGDAASKPASWATSSAASSAAVPTQTGGASGNNNANGNSSGSAGGKGGATSNAILGLAAPAVTDSGDSSRPFSVNGNSFISKASAVQRACDIQRNSCFNAINGGQGNGASTSECDAQVQACIQELS